MGWLAEAGLRVAPTTWDRVSKSGGLWAAMCRESGFTCDRVPTAISPERCATIQHTLEVANPDFRGDVFDYRHLVSDSLAEPPAPCTIFRAAMTGWDNTPRRQHNATIFLNASPEIYELWMRGLVERTIAHRSVDQRLVFINAWNEWAEGAYIEPDQRHGLVYLEATRRALLPDGPSGTKD